MNDRSASRTPARASHTPARARARLGLACWKARAVGSAVLAAVLVGGVVAPVSASAHPPTTPSGLSAAVVDGVVTLSWDAPAHDAAAVSGYQVLRRRPGIDAVGSFHVVEHDTGTAATSWADADATEPGGAYTYRVKAWRASQLSGWSRYARIDLSHDHTPPPPQTDNPDPGPDPNPDPDPDPVPVVGDHCRVVGFGSHAYCPDTPDPDPDPDPDADADPDADTSKSESSSAVVAQTSGHTPSSTGFQSVDAGWKHACALRNDGTLSCWGRGMAERKNHIAWDPDGIFTQVVAGRDQSCAVREDGSAFCWERGFTPPDDGKTRAYISSNNRYGVCWLNTDTTIGCQDMVSPSGSGYKSVTAGYRLACALNADDEAVCWRWGYLPTPDGTFKDLSVGGVRACGIKMSDDADIDGTVVCWRYQRHGSFNYDQADPPSDKFIDIEAHYTQTCGVTVAGDIKCWAATAGSEQWITEKVPMMAPKGVFKTVSLDWWIRACGLKNDATIQCWNYDGSSWQPPANESPWHDSADLLSLELSGIELDFDRDTTSYTVSVDHAVSATSLSAGATNLVASVAVTFSDSTTTPGHRVSGQSLSLAAGANTLTLAVTAADGVTTKTYTVTINRASG